MGSSLAFKITAMHDDELTAVDELNKFLASPQSIGLDNFKESLRNFVQLMMELKYGGTAGYALQHLVHDDHNSMSVEGTLPADRKKKRRKDQDAVTAMIEKILREWNESMKNMLERVNLQIDALHEVIDKELTKLDFQLESLAKEQVPEDIRERKVAKRNKLKQIKSSVRKQEKILDDAQTHQEILDIEQKIQSVAQKLKKKATALPVPEIVENLTVVAGAAAAAQGISPELSSPHNTEEDEDEDETISGSTDQSESPPEPTFQA